eukprot:9467470-Pyramimonas_sp.AAC.2
MSARVGRVSQENLARALLRGISEPRDARTSPKEWAGSSQVTHFWALSFENVAGQTGDTTREPIGVMTLATTTGRTTTTRKDEAGRDHPR